MRKTTPLLKGLNLFIFLIYWCPFALTGQPDSFQQALEKLATNQDRLQQLSTWADSMKMANRPQALQFAEQGLQTSMAEQNQKWRAQFNEQLGEIYNLNASYDSSLLFFNAALKHYQDINNPLKQAQLFKAKGLVFVNQGEFGKAIEMNMNALDFYESADDRLGIADIYRELANVYFYNTTYEKGVEYAEKAIETGLELADKALLIDAYAAASSNYLGLEKPEKALLFIDKAVSIHRETGNNPLELASLINDKGNALKHLNRFDEALSNYQECYTIVEEINHLGGISAIGANIGDIYYRMQQYQDAIPYFLASINIQEKNGYYSNILENYDNLINAYEELSDYKNALKYSEKYRNRRDSLFSIEKEQIMADLDAKYQTVKKEELIEEQKVIIAQSQKIQYLSFGIAISLAAMLASLFFFFRKNKKKNILLNEQNILIEKKNAQNELLLKEIHHRVKNNLETVSSLLALQSASIEDPTVIDAMLESQNRVQSMGMIHQKLYQGENLAAIEMKDYFVNLSEGVLDSFGAKNRIQVECAMQQLELDVDTAVPIGLIVNELLTNSLKYAFPDGRKGHIKISLQKVSDHNLKLTISDNGIGKNMSAAKKSKGFGTQLIQLLTKQINGKLEEVINRGTIVSLQFQN